MPTLIRGWRKKVWEQKVDTIRNRFLIQCFSQMARRPKLFQFATDMAILLMKPFARDGWIPWMPFATSWTANRDLLAPQGKSFLQQYHENRERHET
jgi:L-lactate dehydrogenase complex protein LldF